MHKLLSGSLSIDQLTIPISDLPIHLAGLKITQLSDLHYDGKRLSNQLLDQAIAASNAVEPDLVVLTGDHVTDDPTPITQLAQRLQHLQSNVGVYAILGNHDIVPRHARTVITEALTSVGIHVLWNQVAYPWGDCLALVGLADLWSREFDPAPVMDSVPSNLPCIVLAHNPDSAIYLHPWRVDLQISGHTHGGQIVIPGLGPFPAWYQKVRRYVPSSLRRWFPYMREDCSKVVKHWEWAQGLHNVEGTQLYVNRGLGTYFPGRCFCPPELTVLTLKRQEVERSPLSTEPTSVPSVQPL